MRSISCWAPKSPSQWRRSLHFAPPNLLSQVLSIHKALSIQAHPDKRLAAQLHEQRPEVYKDANHKPEIAIALSEDFQALCGFRRVSELLALLPHVPELAELVGPAVGLLKKAETSEQQFEAMRQAYTNVRLGS